MRHWELVAAVLAAVGLLTAMTALGSGPLLPGLPIVNDSDSLEADFALFTTEATSGVFDDKVTCTAVPEEEDEPPIALVHLTVTNFDPDTVQLNIIFADGDSVLIFAPTGTTVSLSQVMGTHIGIDDEITFDPLDQDGDVNPMAGWVSILEEDADAVSCNVITATTP